MARFKWHADYFDGPYSTRCVRRTIIAADNAGAAEAAALEQMGRSQRVEIRRMATSAPVRVLYAREAARRVAMHGAPRFAFGINPPTPMVT